MYVLSPRHLVAPHLVDILHLVNTFLSSSKIHLMEWGQYW